MRSFEYNTPTHVVFGKDSVEKVGALVAEQGCKKVLIHYGGGSAKRSGLLDRVSQSLDRIRRRICYAGRRCAESASESGAGGH